VISETNSLNVLDCFCWISSNRRDATDWTLPLHRRKIYWVQLQRAIQIMANGKLSAWRETLWLKRNDNKVYEVVPGTQIAISGAWTVWKFGDDHWPLFVCKSEFSDFGVVWCEGSTGERFAFNAMNNRFITDDLVGYIQAAMPGCIGVDGKQLPEGSNTPDISIGKCSAL
jgi:hypothetical protein